MSTPAITTDTHVFFYSGGSIYSNWHTTPRQFVDPLNGNLAFDSSEVAFIWQKAVFFQDHRIATLLEQKGMTAATAKQLGRQIKGYDDAAWECVRLGFMTYVNLLKYRQNPEWGAELKETKGRILIEASPTDKIWGVGLDIEAAVEYAKQREWDGVNPRHIEWPGRNLLGEALMTVRGLLD